MAKSTATKSGNTWRNFAPGQRVQAHPATDLFMRGVRFGTVVSIGRKLVTVQFDALPKAVTMHPRNLLEVL